jgi:hypothetical protein
MRSIVLAVVATSALLAAGSAPSRAADVEQPPYSEQPGPPPYAQVPPPPGPYAVAPAPVEEAVVPGPAYVYGGYNYCWFSAGWHGPGWYVCNYGPWVRGSWWGGPVGWRGWVWRGGPRYWHGARFGPHYVARPGVYVHGGYGGYHHR